MDITKGWVRFTAKKGLAPMELQNCETYPQQRNEVGGIHGGNLSSRRPLTSAKL